MLSEQITVTTTPTSIRQLIATARSAALAVIPRECAGIQMRYNTNETAVITLSDADHGGGSASGSVILDANGEGIVYMSIEQFEIEKALLNCDSGTVTVHVIIPRVL